MPPAAAAPMLPHKAAHSSRRRVMTAALAPASGPPAGSIPSVTAPSLPAGKSCGKCSAGQPVSRSVSPPRFPVSTGQVVAHGPGSNRCTRAELSGEPTNKLPSWPAERLRPAYPAPSVCPGSPYGAVRKTRRAGSGKARHPCQPLRPVPFVPRRPSERGHAGPRTRCRTARRAPATATGPA